MSGLEDELRTMFATRPAAPPATVGGAAHDPAERAIRRGRAARMRRTTGGSAAAVLALIITVVGGSPTNWWPAGEHSGPGLAARQDAVPVSVPSAPEPLAFDDDPAAAAALPGRHEAEQDAVGQDATRLMVAPTPAAVIGVDLRVGNQLWTVEGRRLPLSGVGQVDRAYRIPVGWVYSGADQVRLLRPDGSNVPLGGGGDRWTVSPDGRRFAYVSNHTLRVADLTWTGLSVRSTTDVPEGTLPVAFLDRRVVVSGRVGQGRGYDLLDPARPYKPAWNIDITAIYGTTGGAVAALVRTADNRLCLATVNSRARGLRVHRSGACTLGLRPEVTLGRLAPGGGWLVAPGPGGLNLVDIDAALTGEHATVSCPIRTTVPAVWADDLTVVAGDHRGVVRCRTDGTQQIVSLPNGADTDWEPVPRMMAKTVTTVGHPGRT